MPDVKTDATLVARCGLYCGACNSYLKGRCAGCAGNDKATWCKVRSCCAEKGYRSCADCTEHADPATCAKFNNAISRVLAVLLNSNRRACVLKIREVGIDGFAAYMAGEKRQSMPWWGARG